MKQEYIQSHVVIYVNLNKRDKRGYCTNITQKYECYPSLISTEQIPSLKVKRAPSPKPNPKVNKFSLLPIPN